MIAVWHRHYIILSVATSVSHSKRKNPIISSANNFLYNLFILLHCRSLPHYHFEFRKWNALGYCVELLLCKIIASIYSRNKAISLLSSHRRRLNFPAQVHCIWIKREWTRFRSYYVIRYWEWNKHGFCTVRFDRFYFRWWSIVIISSSEW